MKKRRLRRGALQKADIDGELHTGKKDLPPTCPYPKRGDRRERNAILSYQKKRVAGEASRG